MRKVIVESPYRGDVIKNIEYARKCVRHCLIKGETPIASHLLYTQVLNDNIPAERELGISAGLDWLEVADAQIFYLDYGMSEGMMSARDIGMAHNVTIEYRRIL